MLSSYRIFVTEEQRALAQMQHTYKILLLAEKNKNTLAKLCVAEVKTSLAGIENYKKQIISQIQTQTVVGGIEEINHFFQEAYELQQSIQELLSKWIEDISLEEDMKKKLAACNETIKQLKITPINLTVQSHIEKAKTFPFWRNTIL